MTHIERVLAVGARPHVHHPAVRARDTSTKLLKDALLLRLPVPLAALLQDAIELFLRILASLFNGGDQVLLVRDAQVPRDIGVLQWLEWRKGGRCVQVRD